MTSEEKVFKILMAETDDDIYAANRRFQHRRNHYESRQPRKHLAGVS